MKNMESCVSKIKIQYYNGETWHRHKARKEKQCFQRTSYVIREYCGELIKPGKYYWLYRNQKDIYCQDCKESKERNEFTPEKITERLFADCKEYNVDPLDIMRLIQNRMDLS